MAPAPATIASTPRQKSRRCWNPAVPPPPVPGAAVGNELADGVGDGVGVGLGGVVLGGAVLGGAVLGALLGVVLGVALAETLGVAPPAENEGGAVDGEPVEHADTDAVASTAMAA
jgi:hypothetical protein